MAIFKSNQKKFEGDNKNIAEFKDYILLTKSVKYL